MQNKFEEAFEVDISGWCYGLKHYPGEMHGALVHGIIREMSPIFYESICNNYAFDLVKVAQRICQACKYLIAEVEVVYSILAKIPSPRYFKNEDQMFTIATILDGVEKKYPGVITRMESRWAHQDELEEKKKNVPTPQETGFIDPFAPQAKKRKGENGVRSNSL